jgi:hypothetical protein
MVNFTRDDNDGLDWRLMQNGAVSLYFRRSVLDKDIDWLREHGYRVEVIDCSSEDEFTAQMSKALRFKEQFGYEPWTGNLNALNDALRNCVDEDCTGLVLCLLRYDTLKSNRPDIGEAVLHYIEYNSRNQMLFGLRLMALVQSDDPKIQFGSLGGRQPGWNPKEWQTSSRA